MYSFDELSWEGFIRVLLEPAKLLLTRPSNCWERLSAAQSSSIMSAVSNLVFWFKSIRKFIFSVPITQKQLTNISFYFWILFFTSVTNEQTVVNY